MKIIPKDKVASPDLKVGIFHTKEYFSIECYQPKKFSGESRVYPRELKKIVDHSMEKAKRQLEEKAPGILAICGFNQPKRIVEVLKQTIAKRLQLSERENLCGIMTVFFGTLYTQDKNKRRFTPIISIDFIANRSYFGRLTIGENEHPKSIGPLEDISPEYVVPLIIKKPSRTRATIPTPITRKVKGIRLKLIKKPAHMSRAVIHAKETLPLFRGEGNNNYLCGQCGVILAEHTWKFSLSNIVVECPCCQSFNEFPKLKKKIELPIFGSVALARGEYYFKNALVLTRGACLFGL